MAKFCVMAGAGSEFSLQAARIQYRLRARQEIKLAFWRERRAGRCKAPRRRRCGDIVEERQRRRCLPAAAPHGLRLPRPANYCGLPVMIQLGMGVAAKCQIILARALSQARTCARTKQSTELKRCNMTARRASLVCVILALT